MHHQPLQVVRSDTGSALALRASITTARTRLRQVLHERGAAIAAATGWVGPHRHRWETDTADLLAAGRTLDRALTDLLTALDAEFGAPTP